MICMSNPWPRKNSSKKIQQVGLMLCIHARVGWSSVSKCGCWLLFLSLLEPYRAKLGEAPQVSVLVTWGSLEIKILQYMKETCLQSQHGSFPLSWFASHCFKSNPNQPNHMVQFNGWIALNCCLSSIIPNQIAEAGWCTTYSNICVSQSAPEA